MTLLLVGLVFLFMVVSLRLWIQNQRLRNQHRKQLGQLQTALDALVEKQKRLMQQTQLTTTYTTTYSQDMQRIGHEVVSLQKMLFERVCSIDDKA